MGAGGQAAIKEMQGPKGKLLRKLRKNCKEAALVWRFAEMKTHPLVCGNGICRHREQTRSMGSLPEKLAHVGGKYKDTQ